MLIPNQYKWFTKAKYSHQQTTGTLNTILDVNKISFIFVNANLEHKKVFFL